MRRLVLLALASALLAHDEEKGEKLAPGTILTDRPEPVLLPLPKEEDVFHFVVYGDRTGGPPEGIRVLAQAVKDTNLLGPDLVMTVGDLVQGYNERASWLAQMAEYKLTMGGLKMPWYPVAGNHDVIWNGSPPPQGHHESDFERHFGPLWYWFPFKNAAFVVLFTDEGDRTTNRKGWGAPELNRISDEQLQWLKKTLRDAADKDHVFVFCHHPKWQPNYPGSNWDAVHKLLKDAKNVTAVFAGHIHRQRYDGKRDGIEYFTLAAVGAGMPFDIPGTGYLHHFNVVTVRKDRIDVATVPVGRVLDPREMTPERLADIDRARALAPLPPDPLTLGADGAADGQGSVRLENPTTRPLAVTLTLDADDALWALAPDHAHFILPPRGGRTLEFRYRRSGDLDALAAPRVGIQVDYLGESMRVALPKTSTVLPVRLAGIPEDLRVARADRALRLGGRGCLTAPLEIPDGPFTVEGWLNASDLAGRRGFLAKTERSDFGILLYDGAPAFHVFVGDAYANAKSTDAVDAATWHHLAGVFDGAEARLYVDGRLVAKGAGSGARRRNPYPFCVGADPDRRGEPTSFFEGRIDEVRVSRVARYSGDAFTPARTFEPDADTLLLLHCDGLVGPFAVDHSPAEAHALRRGEVACGE